MFCSKMTEHRQRDDDISVTWRQTVFTSFDSNETSLSANRSQTISVKRRVRLCPCVCVCVLYLCRLLCRVLVLVPGLDPGPWQCFCTALPRSSHSTPRHGRPWTRDRTSHCASLQTQAYTAVVKIRRSLQTQNTQVSSHFTRSRPKAYLQIISRYWAGVRTWGRLLRFTLSHTERSD